jgi:hypothetical protein
MTSRPLMKLVLAILPLAAGCATLSHAPTPEQDASLRLESGLEAFRDGRHSEAFDDLAWIVAACPEREAGLHARVALAALELDPRNPGGRPDVGMHLLADLILDPTTPSWVRPAAESTYLLGRALGAPAPRGEAAEPDPDGADPDPDAARDAQPADPPDLATPPAPTWGGTAVRGCGPALERTDTLAATLPVLPGPSLAAMLMESEATRDRLQDRVDLLEEQLERMRQELVEARAELERIRRTLRP